MSNSVNLFQLVGVRSTMFSQR